MPILLHSPEPGVAYVLRDTESAPPDAVRLRPGESWQQIPFEVWTSFIGERVQVAEVLKRYQADLGVPRKGGEFCLDCGSVLEVGRVTLEGSFWRFFLVGVSWIDLFFYPKTGKRRLLLHQGADHPARLCPTCGGVWVTR